MSEEINEYTVKVGEFYKLKSEMEFMYFDEKDKAKIVIAPKGTVVDIIAVCPTDDNRNTSQGWSFAVVSYPDEMLDLEPYTLIGFHLLDKV